MQQLSLSASSVSCAPEWISTEREQLIFVKLANYLRDIYNLNPKQEIAVLLSGGVDSSVVLASLQYYGCTHISAYYLKIWFQEDAQFLGDCPWEEDLEYAASVCEQLDIPLHVLPMQQEYYDFVVSYTLTELRRGKTPSPDLFCNQAIKFGCFLRHLPSGGNIIASGHYALLWPAAITENMPQEFLLRQAPDKIKDQSYFLSQMQQAQLQKLLFPLGCLEKAEVRHLAQVWNLPTAKRKDSQGICFLGKVKFRDFTAHYLGRNPGPIIDIQTGRDLGQHQGIWFYTIGQRHGLGYLANGPWYVCAKDIEQNYLYVCKANALSQNNAQLVYNFWVEPPNWLQSFYAWEQLRQTPGCLQLKLRHGPIKINCQLKKIKKRWQVQMQKADRGVAPGQFAVFYWGDICLGSAKISEAI